MMQDRYDILVESPVYLEEIAHVYIHKKTKKRYPSVTTVLSLIKNEFPHEVKNGIIKQYEQFINWMASNKYTFKNNKDFFLQCLNLYVNYKDYRPYTETNLGYKRYAPIKSYKNINEFLDEFLHLQDTVKLTRFKTIYLNKDGSIMSENEMQQFWYDITEAANIYGSMVHEIVEQYILLKQRFVITNNIHQSIETRFNHLKSFLESMDYPYSNHVFEEYIIKGDIETFKQHIIKSFNDLGADLGRVCVPERLMFNEEWDLAGMSDVFIEDDDEYFSIGDHKTNKEFTEYNKYGVKLKAPFDNYDECDLILYNLQLSLYALMYEFESGKKLKKMWISYYSRRENKFIYIDLKYLRDEALQLISIYRNFLSEISVKYEKSGILKDVPQIYHNHLMFILEKTIKTHKAQNFYEGKSKDEIRKWFDNFINQYVSQQNKLND